MSLWYGASAVAAIVIAWVAAMIHASGHAPIGLVSIGVGAALGACFSGIAALQQIRANRRLIIGAILLAILAVVAEHAWLYIDFRRQWQQSRASAQVAIFRSESPPSPVEYFSREASPVNVTLWCLDAILIVTISGTTVHLARRNRASNSP